MIIILINPIDIFTVKSYIISVNESHYHLKFLVSSCKFQATIQKPTKQKEDDYMPLTMAKQGEVNYIKKVGGKEETRKFLENLGFVAGGMVIIVSQIGGNMIVNVKDSRVAINKDMANKIMI